MELDDLLAELVHARRRGDLGRLALMAWCEVRRWARQEGHGPLARRSAAMFTEQPHASREAFLAEVDRLIEDLSRLQAVRLAPGRSPGAWSSETLTEVPAPAVNAPRTPSPPEGC